VAHAAGAGAGRWPVGHGRGSDRGKRAGGGVRRRPAPDFAPAPRSARRAHQPRGLDAPGTAAARCAHRRLHRALRSALVHPHRAARPAPVRPGDGRLVGGQRAGPGRRAVFDASVRPGDPRRVPANPVRAVRRRSAGAGVRLQHAPAAAEGHRPAGQACRPAGIRPGLRPCAAPAQFGTAEIHRLVHLAAARAGVDP